MTWPLAVVVCVSVVAICLTVLIMMAMKNDAKKDPK